MVFPIWSSPVIVGCWALRRARTTWLGFIARLSDHLRSAVSRLASASAKALALHGGGLVNDQPDSPHKRADKIRSKVYVAGAIEDGSFTDEAKATLTKTLADAKVPATVETYPAHHGFAVPDHKGAYDPAAQERHFQAMDKLFAHCNVARRPVAA